MHNQVLSVVVIDNDTTQRLLDIRDISSYKKVAKPTSSLEHDLMNKST